MPDPTLTDVAEWVAAIYELQTTDQVLAGPGGIANRQAQELAHRTAYLKELLDGRIVPLAPSGTVYASPDVAEMFVGIQPDGLKLHAVTAYLGDGVNGATVWADIGVFKPVVLSVGAGETPALTIGDSQLELQLPTPIVRLQYADGDVVFAQNDIAGAAWGRAITLKGHGASGFGACAGWVSILGGDAEVSGASVGGSVFLGPGAGAAKGNLHIGAKAGSTQGMQLGVFVGNTAAAPTGNPTGGFFHWSDGGVPAWRDMEGRTVRMPDIMVLRGAYSVATTYVAGAVVTYAGGLWRAEDEVTGYAPNVEDGWWTLLAPAPTGDLGDEGKALLLGPNGASFVRSPHIERSGHVQTTDATTTTVLSYAPAAEEVVQVVVNVHCKRVSDQTSAIFRKRASFRVHAGAVTQIGATAEIGSDVDAGAATWTVAIDTSSGQIRVRVTGAAGATIDWQAYAVVTPYGI